ncbi:MAG: hypothetical protein ABSG86_25345 [Thermoguttaceae bacterium]|jgi:hypothetical protein
MLADHQEIPWSEDKAMRCPVHGGAFRKIYTYGSTMSAETDVVAFRGCGCAVSIAHDPVGTYPSVARYHRAFAGAAGLGRLRAMDAAAKYR